MLDFSLNSLNTDNPSPLSVIYALTASFILACLISFTFQKTSRHIQAPGHFIQSMILGSIIATIVTIAIGDNIGRGLGMLGIMAIIRFRTNITQARNMIFMFSALGIGIACGVFAFNIAIYGTAFFCIVAFLLILTNFEHFPKKNQSLRIQLSEDIDQFESQVEYIFRSLKINGQLSRIENRINNEQHEIEYNWDIENLSDSDGKTLLQTLNKKFRMNSLRFIMRIEEQII
ncbi:MAG: DUF4956 domain-containing protein [Saprospiraceae bacterium]|nr:DUF4956 domain-containing protein [Saprospiraceae bacterium]